MKIETGIKIFLTLVGLAFLSIAIQALFTPQLVMDNVDIQLTNISAKSSTMGFYGGVNLLLGLYIIYAGFKNQSMGLILAALYGGGFVIGRLLSLIMDGMPNSFVLTWLGVESTLTLIALLLYFNLNKKNLI